MADEILIIGATGTVGREVAQRVVRTGARVRALVRTEASAARLPPGVAVTLGDLRDPQSLRRAATGMKSVFFVAPHEPDEERLADHVVSVCEAAHSRLVFVGVHLDGRFRLSRWVQRMLFSRIGPHYAPKFRLSERVRRSGCSPIILMPTNFFQNDELFRDELEAGRFPQSFLRPINRVDVRDLGSCAARCLVDGSIAAGAYPVLGPCSLDAEQCARVWSAQLGREVRPQNDPAACDEAITRALAGRKREDFLASYAVLRRFAMPTEPEALARTEALLGRAPTPYESYVADAVARWRGPAAALA